MDVLYFAVHVLCVVIIGKWLLDGVYDKPVTFGVALFVVVAHAVFATIEIAKALT